MIAHEKTERTNRMHSTTRATQPVCVISVSSWLEKTNSARTEIVLPPGKSFEKSPANTVAHAQGRVKRINHLQQIPDALHDTRLRVQMAGSSATSSKQLLTGIDGHRCRPTPHRTFRITTHYSLLTTHYSLLTTHYSLLTTHQSSVANHHPLRLNARRHKPARPVAVLYV